ncbi:MAG: DUF429 domain-containing protein [Verrucomicrobia bacterium]|jgi:uncharacterized protein YprB with RNaseH-like and TPR domain/predicted nuclease with RNAse H fold/dephospho-CoA kinase|nr:DUF429 domain-containing protein [Verrucomicrobiota bacterium]
MIRKTFLHLPGVGPKTEEKFWALGIHDWEDLESRCSKQLISSRKVNWRANLVRAIRDSETALESADSNFFSEKLPPASRSRIIPAFADRVLFLDIETTGLSHYYDDITIIGALMNGEYQAFIEQSDVAALQRLVDTCSLITTFNGSRFDLKFIKEKIPKLRLNKPHIDLYFYARRLFLSGGQKAIEKKLGVRRPDHVKDLKGFEAPKLWHSYLSGNARALEILIEYNKFDLEGMVYILKECVEKEFQHSRMPNVQDDLKQLSRLLYDKERDGRDGVTKSVFIWFPRTQGKTYTPRYTDLVEKTRDQSFCKALEALRIVGIDLTGSEKRATGWAGLDGSIAQTALIRGDEELVSKTVAFCPDIVSIDSPLSLPRGRTRVDDGDPARDTAGIMRKCEVMLKSRGVNVYPSLILHMQKLTARGIALAKRFRAAGVPVIESYPGAAQDIIRVPRKQMGLEALADGLEQFGVKGDFTSSKATHDELDAITAAVVGMFFWAGYFEGLGDEHEDYLIVPDCRRTESVWSGHRTIGFSGPTSAGKTTAAKVLSGHGFKDLRMSAFVERLAVEQRRPTTRAELRALGSELHDHYGQRWLCAKLWHERGDAQSVVVDGLRFPEDHAFFVEKSGPMFRHVAINAAVEIRRARYLARGGSNDEFEVACRHPVESKIRDVMALAGTLCHNSSSLEHFKNEIQQILSVR